PELPCRVADGQDNRMTRSALHPRRLPALPVRAMWLVALLALSPLLPLAAGANPNTDDPVTIYRCTDGDGRLSLRDTPCLPGERQQAREMLRPQDPPPRPADVAAPASAPLASSDPGPATPERMRIAPPPVYRCTTPDGAQYTSDSADGNPR